MEKECKMILVYLLFLLLFNVCKCGLLNCVTEYSTDSDIYLPVWSILDLCQLRYNEKTHISENPGESVILYSPEVEENIKRICEGEDIIWQSKKNEKCVLLRLNLRENSTDILSLTIKKSKMTEFKLFERDIEDDEWKFVKEEILFNRQSIFSISKRLRETGPPPVLDITDIANSVISTNISKNVHSASFFPANKRYFGVVTEWKQQIWEGGPGDKCIGVWLYTSSNNYTSLITLYVKNGLKTRFMRYEKMFTTWRPVNEDEFNRMFICMKRVKYTPKAVIKNREEVDKYIDHSEPFIMHKAFVRLTQLSDDVFEDAE